MDEFFDIPTLIVIGLAIVVLFRLRQVLGTRTGRERSPLERQREIAAAKQGEENVVQMRPRPTPQTSEDQERHQRKLEADVARPMLGWRKEYFTRWPYVKNLVPHNALYNYGRMQDVWLDK